jgi:sortase A
VFRRKSEALYGPRSVAALYQSLRPMKMQIRSFSRAAEYVLIFVGVCALGYACSVVLAAKIYQHIERREFSRALQTKTVSHADRVSVSFSAKATRKSPADGAMIGSLSIPRLGLSTVVVEGVGDRDLNLAAGHIPGTSFPGQRGNVGIAGHRDTVFRPLRGIRKDDAITVTTLSGEFRYRVVSTKIVEPDHVQVLFPAKTETLTLVTCYPFNFVGPAPQRFIIQAERLLVNP